MELKVMRMSAVDAIQILEITTLEVKGLSV